MAATSPRGRVAAAGLVGLAVVALVAIGPCRGGDGATAPLPPPSVDGLSLTAEVRGDEVALTVALADDAERSIEVPRSLLAHRGHLDDGGGVVLSVGRGRAEDVEPMAHDGPSPPPVLIEPGTTVDLEALLASDWVGRDGPADASARDVDEAAVVRVCLWGVAHPVGATPASVSEATDTRRLVCVDVSG